MKKITPEQVKETADAMHAQIRAIFVEFLPADEVQAAMDELHERLALVHYTAFTLGFSADYCDNAQGILILDILRARRNVQLAKGYNPLELVAFILGRH